jgi:hypothetical protein
MILTDKLRWPGPGTQGQRRRTSSLRRDARVNECGRRCKEVTQVDEMRWIGMQMRRTVGARTHIWACRRPGACMPRSTQCRREGFPGQERDCSMASSGGWQRPRVRTDNPSTDSHFEIASQRILHSIALGPKDRPRPGGERGPTSARLPRSWARLLVFLHSMASSSLFAELLSATPPMTRVATQG